MSSGTDLDGRLRAIIERGAARRATDEDLRQCRGNLTGFFGLLRAWSMNQAVANRSIGSISNSPAAPVEKEIEG